MKKHTSTIIAVTACVLVFAVLYLSGCSQHPQDGYATYEVSENEELGCIELHHDGIIYRPYGGFYNNDFRGQQIGIREGDPESKICEVRGYDSKEWITEYLDVFMGGGDMLYKAVGLTDIPEELGQFKDYDY